MKAQFAYLFERFPSFTQTFCYREVVELFRQGGRPVLCAIRRPVEVPAEVPEEVVRAVHYLPDDLELRATIKAACAEGTVARKPARALLEWGKLPDKSRLYEAMWLGPILREQGIGHVHAHFCGIAARAAYWLKKFYGITYSFTGHANDIFCETGFSVTLKDLLAEAELVVTETDYSRDWLRGRHPAFAGKIHRVYNGIDPAPFAEAKPAPGVPRIVSVGRCIEKKGFADLIEACALLRQRGVAFECVIVGGGPLEEPLRARVAERGLQGVVTLTGPRPQDEVRRILSEASVFALACVEETGGGMDNFPTVIVEAMASSLPVVSTRLAGVPEMIREGENGLLTPPGDPPAFAVALETLLTDPERARRLGAEGRRTVLERFASEVTAQELLALLETCPNVRQPPAGKGGLKTFFGRFLPR